MLEDFADHLILPSFNEGNDLHRAAAFGTYQRIDMIDALNEHGPAAAGEAVGYYVGGRWGWNGRRAGDSRGLVIWRARCPRYRLAARLVGIAAIVTNEMLALVGYVLGQFRQKIQRLEHLIIARHTAKQSILGRQRIFPAMLLVGLVNHLPLRRDPQQPGEAERAARHVLGETLEGVRVAGGNAHGAVDVKAAVMT